IGSRWRALNPGQQALLVLVYLRKNETYAETAAGFGVGATTAWRYADETVALLAARAPKPRRAGRDRPGRRGPALLFRQAPAAPEARDEPAGHRQSVREDSVGVRRTARLSPRQEGRMDLGRARRAGSRWPDSAGG